MRNGENTNDYNLNWRDRRHVHERIVIECVLYVSKYFRWMITIQREASMWHISVSPTAFAGQVFAACYVTEKGF